MEKNPVFQTKPSSEYPKEEPKLDPQIHSLVQDHGGYFDTSKQDLSFLYNGLFIDFTIQLYYFF